MTIERNRTAQWFADDYEPKARWDRLRKLLLHTTETPSRSRHGSKLWAWPGYSAGSSAPNATLLPDLQGRRLLVREHFPANAAARALRNGSEPGETNAVPGGVHQVELVGTCAPSVSRDWQRRCLVPGVDFVEWWRPPAWCLDALAAYWLDLHRRYGIPLKLGSALWPAYPSSPAMDRAARMGRREFERAEGLVGHLHAPENEHLDPGAFPAGDLLRRALALASGTPTTPSEDDMPTPRDLWAAKVSPLGGGALAIWRRIGGKDATPPAEELLKVAFAQSVDAARLSRAALAEIAALRVEVATAAKGGPVDLAAVQEAARRGVADAMDGVEATVTLNAD